MTYVIFIRSFNDIMVPQSLQVNSCPYCCNAGVKKV